MGFQLPFPQLVNLPDFWTINLSTGAFSFDPELIRHADSFRTLSKWSSPNSCLPRTIRTIRLSSVLVSGYAWQKTWGRYYLFFFAKQKISFKKSWMAPHSMTRSLLRPIYFHRFLTLGNPRWLGRLPFAQFLQAIRKVASRWRALR